ncbi:Quinone oxidoreductase 2 [Aquisphaera giovannonii]|uniref:Quinone oxidoreductase 2 n=1 Tax=Aquisphaera giovannonii TaxID=406548 RepID=A0A5B9WEC9_9BACT|nr:NmrA family NAD(P)-binding protein [Aquisphaera giovannonii]QEH38589.1 Quinone oxidoreductase 2 [Aquisphaera giovannonii]
MGKYLATGATGQLGGASVDFLLEKVPANRVAVLVRDPAKAARFKERGVEVVRGDYFDYRSLVDAFGVEKLLLIGAPALTDRAPQHENMMRAVKAAKPGLVVYVTLQRREGSGVVIREVSDVEPEAERALIDSGVGYIILRNSLYSGAFKPLLAPNYREKGVRAFGPEGKTTYADVADLAQANANLLVDPGRGDRIYNMNAGERLTFPDVARLLSEVEGRPVAYHSLPRQQLVDEMVAAGVPLRGAEFAMDFVNAIGQGEFSEPSDALEKILGRKPVTLKEAFRRDWKPA